MRRWNFNTLLLENGDWKTILSFWDGLFSGATAPSYRTCSLATHAPPPPGHTQERDGHPNPSLMMGYNALTQCTWLYNTVNICKFNFWWILRRNMTEWVRGIVMRYKCIKWGHVSSERIARGPGFSWNPGWRRGNTTMANIILP